MKTRLLSLALVAILLFSMTSCFFSNDKENDETQPPEEKTVLTNAMDLTAEWNKVSQQNSLVQGCIVVRRAFLEEHPDAVEHFLTEYEASIAYLSTDLDNAAKMIAENGIFNSAPVAKKALPNCNVCFLDGTEMKNAMNTYLGILHGIAPASVGGKLPADDFYYTRKSEIGTTTAGRAINVYTLNGTTGFGMAKLMNDAKAGTTTEQYAFSVQTDASNVTAALLNGSADIAALPTNAAANVYNKSEGAVVVLAVNTLGCLYVLTNQNETITSFEDLRGKTVYVPAQNPTFIFTYLCKQNGLEVGKDIFINSTTYAQPPALKDAVAAGLVDIAVLPEPMVTIAINTAAAAAK